MKLLSSLLGVVGDVARVALAPVEIAADLTRAVTKPIADVAEETVQGVREIVGQPEKKK